MKRDTLKRESGEKPEQTRYCNRLQHPAREPLPKRWEGAEVRRKPGNLPIAENVCLREVRLLFNFFTFFDEKDCVDNHWIGYLLWSSNGGKQ